MKTLYSEQDGAVAEQAGADVEAAYVAEAGLPHLIGFLEKRADIGRLPMPLYGIDDAEAERYFAFYSLLPSLPLSGTERTGAGAERRAS